MIGTIIKINFKIITKITTKIIPMIASREGVRP